MSHVVHGVPCFLWGLLGTRSSRATTQETFGADSGNGGRRLRERWGPTQATIGVDPRGGFSTIERKRPQASRESAEGGRTSSKRAG